MGYVTIKGLKLCLKSKGCVEDVGTAKMSAWMGHED